MFKTKFLTKDVNKKTSIDALIGPGMIIKGNVLFSGGLNIDGKVIGNIEANDKSRSLLIISASSQIKGTIKVSNVVINGRIDGDVIAVGHLELANKANITGNVYYNVLKMSAGARINGSLLYKPNEHHPKLEHQPKRQASTKKRNTQ
jgi:cytoskeletal protein CcmA (bactofilin family)